MGKCQKKILVVEDEPDILKVVSFRLKAAGYQIMTSQNGKEALNLTREQRPDLILLDLRLPVLDGYEVCKYLKKDKELKQIPIILLTASEAFKTADSFRALKADDYVIKPFNPKELLEKIKKII